MPLAQASRELFGALFLPKQFNYTFSAQGIFKGQSPVIRYRDFPFDTYDPSYAVCVGLAWLIGAWLMEVVAFSVCEIRAGRVRTPINFRIANNVVGAGLRAAGRVLSQKSADCVPLHAGFLASVRRGSRGTLVLDGETDCRGPALKVDTGSSTPGAPGLARSENRSVPE